MATKSQRIMSDTQNTERSETMKLTLTNNFHNTSVNVVVSDPNEYGEHTLSDSQVRRVRRELCGMQECGCGAVRDAQWMLNDCPGHVATLEPR